MSEVQKSLIGDLVNDLEPVKTINPASGFGIIVSLSLFALALVALFMGVRADLAMGMVDEMFFLRSGVLLMLGVATGLAVVNMARPGVGKLSRGWVWALGAAALFPVTAIIMSIINTPPIEALRPNNGVECLAVSMLCASVIGTGLTVWLKQGAPTSPERAGWLIGMASGALGAAAYNIHCPFNDIYYIGLWFTLSVMASAVIGRITVPHLIRW